MSRDLTTREADALHQRAVGIYPGAELPHPQMCGCSAHVKPCPHDRPRRDWPWGSNPVEDPDLKPLRIWCERCLETIG